MTHVRRRISAPLSMALAAFLVLAAAVFVLAAPNPSGSGVPAIGVDAMLEESLEHEGATYLVQPSVDPVGAEFQYNTTYDFTLTNISTTTNPGTGHGYSGAPTGLRLCGPDGNTWINPRDLGTDDAHAGMKNVTFPSALLNATGVWTIESNVTTAPACNGIVVANVFVHPRTDLAVSLSPPVLAHSPDPVSFTVTVAGLQGGQAASIEGWGVPAGTTVTAASPNYTYFGPSPDVGAYVYNASVNVDGVGLAELKGSGTLTVTDEDIVVSATEDGAPLASLGVREAGGAPTTGPAGSYTIQLSIVDGADGSTPQSGAPDWFGPSNVTVSGDALFLASSSSWSYDGAGTLTIPGVTPTRAGGHVLFAVAWKGQVTTLDLPIARGAWSALSPAALTAGHTSQLTLTLRDAFGNPVPDGKAYLFRMPSGDASSQLAGPTAINGTGAPGAGQNGQYVFALAPGVVGDYVAYGIAGRMEPTVDHRNFTYASFRVVEGEAEVSIGDVTGSILHPVTAPIRIANVSDFGTATVTLVIDPNVVNVVDVTAGDVPEAQTTWSFDDASSTLTILVTTENVPGAGGALVLANVVLEAVGSPGGSSPLDLSVVEAAHSDGSPIATLARDGTFYAGLVGDADGDGTVGPHDVLVIAEYVVHGGVGDIEAANADANRDGVVTGVDAMFIRQFLAGERESL